MQSLDFSAIFNDGRYTSLTWQYINDNTRMKWWTDCCDQLFPGFNTLAIACASTTWIDIAMEVEISVPSEASNWQTKTDPQFTALCINPWTLPLKGWPNWRLAALYKNNYWNCPESHWYHLQSIRDISEVRCLHRAKDSPRHSLFTLLPTYILLCSLV